MPETGPSLVDLAVDQNRHAELESHIAQGFRKTDTFLSQLYGNAVPDRIKNRFDRLQTDPSAIHKQADIDRKQWGEGVATAGKHDIANGQDRLILTDASDEKNVIHEMTHFLSYDPDTSKSGIMKKLSDEDLTDSAEIRLKVLATIVNPESNDPIERKPNEAITEIIANVIYRELDPNDPEVFHKVAGYLHAQREMGEMRSSRAYQDYIFNALSFLGKNMDTAGFPVLMQKYFAGDNDAFEKTLEEYAISKRLFRISDPDIGKRFYEETKVEGKEASEAVKGLISNTADRFVQDPRFTQDQKQLVTQLATAISADGSSVQFKHGEYMREGIKIQRYQKESPVDISVNTDLATEFAPHLDEHNEIIPYRTDFPALLEGYLLWQGIRFDQLKKQPQNEEAIREINVFEHPLMQDFLCVLTPTEYAYTLLYLRDRYHASFYDEEVQKQIVDKRIAQFPDTNGGFDIVKDGDLAQGLARNHAKINMVSMLGKVMYIPKIDIDDAETFYGPAA